MMNIREERNKNTEQAWNALYNRLEKDGLLVARSTEVPPSRSLLKARVVQWGTAVAALFIGMVLAFFWFGRDAVPATDALVLHNAKGEPTLVTTLEDGTTIYLSDQASVEYPSSFARDKREIALQGDAFFEVNSQPERPFIIHTPDIMIEVLGTSFNVKNSSEEAFALSVRSGKVKVTTQKAQQTAYVNAGETVHWDNNKLRILPTGDMEQFNHYLRHIHFKDQALGDIVRFINDNTRAVQLEIEPELYGRQVNVTFLNNTPETMAQILCLTLNLEYTVQQDTIYITRRH